MASPTGSSPQIYEEIDYTFKPIFLAAPKIRIPFIECLSRDTIFKLQQIAESELLRMDTGLNGNENDISRADVLSAFQWLREQEIIQSDEFIKKVRDKMFGGVIKNELNLTPSKT